MKLRSFLLLPCLLLTACGSHMQPADFAQNTPVVDPLAFFTGHIHSWGLVETASGAPDDPFTTEMTGTRDPDGTLHLAQDFSFADGRKATRNWTFRKTGEHDYEGTAADVEGPAHGETYGNLFHWTYVLELDPGNRLRNVAMEQWMYLQSDGTILNRVTVRKLGLTVAMVTEYFTKQ